MPAEIPERIRSRIEEIHADNTSGAVSLAIRSSEILALLSRSFSERPERAAASAFHIRLVAVCRALVASQPAMASILNLANLALSESDRAAAPALGPRAVEAACRNYVQALRTSAGQICRHTTRLLTPDVRVITHSYSQTVLEALIAAHGTGKRLRVICTESRPIGEGTALANRLGEAGIQVTLATDAAIYSLMGKADIAITGADSVSARGLVNKTGTSLLALAARECKRDFYALCGSEKFLPAEYEPPPEQPRPAAEIAPPAPNVSVENFYFDRTPLELVTGVVTEHGILTRGELNRRLLQLRLHPALTRRTDT